MFNGLEITEVNVHPVPDKNACGSTQAIVRLVLNGALVINSIRVVKGKFGMFVSFPREYNKSEKKGYNICFPISKVFHEYMSERILNEYEAVASSRLENG